MKHTATLNDLRKKIIIFSGFYTKYKIINHPFYKSLENLNYSILAIEINYNIKCDEIIDEIYKIIKFNNFTNGVIITISSGGIIGCRYIEKYNNVRGLITMDMTTCHTIGFIERNIEKIKHDKKKVEGYIKIMNEVLADFNIATDIKIIHHMNYGSDKQKEIKINYLTKITPTSQIIEYPNNIHNLFVSEEKLILENINTFFTQTTNTDYLYIIMYFYICIIILIFMIITISNNENLKKDFHYYF
jgi:hypothetical protein